MSMQENQLGEIISKCKSCGEEITYAAMAGSVCAGGISFLHGEKEGFYIFDCPKCGIPISQKTGIDKIFHIKKFLGELGQHPDGNDFVIQYNSFPYQLDSSKKDSSIPRYFKPISPENKKISKDELDIFISKRAGNNNGIFCSYSPDDIAFAPAAAVWWYTESEIEKYLFAEVKGNKKRHFPRYYYYDNAFEFFHEFVWDYKLKFKSIHGIDLAYPNSTLRNAMAVPLHFEYNQHLAFINLQTLDIGRLVPYCARNINAMIEPFAKEHYHVYNKMFYDDIKMRRIGEYEFRRIQQRFQDRYFEESKEFKIAGVEILNFISSLMGHSRLSKCFLPDAILLYNDYLDKYIRKVLNEKEEDISLDFGFDEEPSLEMSDDELGDSNFSEADLIEILEEDDDAENVNIIILNPEVLKNELSILEGKYGTLKRIRTQNQKLMELKYKLCEVAKFDVNVLILGETGTGKELFARSVHESSERRGNFVPVNCAGIPKELFESELFGHKKGAFSGAVSDKKGAFEAANYGTLFLDELGEMPIDLQAKILRALEYKEIAPVGSPYVQQVNVKLVFATNRDLQREVEIKNFREDLFFRIFTPCLPIPPLRERKDDIPILVKYFIMMFGKKFNKQIKSMSKDIIDRFQAYHWKGNVRELMKLMEMMVLNSHGPKLTTRDLPEFHAISKEFESVQELNVEVPPARTATDEDIKYWLEKLQGNKTQVANRLGISYRTVLRRCQKMGI